MHIIMLLESQKFCPKNISHSDYIKSIFSHIKSDPFFPFFSFSKFSLFKNNVLNIIYSHVLTKPNENSRLTMLFINIH